MLSRRELLAGAAAVAVVPAPVELSGQDLYASILGPYAEGIQVDTVRTALPAADEWMAQMCRRPYEEELGIAAFTDLVERDWQTICASNPIISGMEFDTLHGARRLGPPAD